MIESHHLYVFESGAFKGHVSDVAANGKVKIIVNAQRQVKY